MFFEVKESSFSSRFFSQIAPLSSLEEAVEPEVFHSQTFKQTNQNSFLDCDHLQSAALEMAEPPESEHLDILREVIELVSDLLRCV